jgi:hypothetical protein
MINRAQRLTLLGGLMMSAAAIAQCPPHWLADPAPVFNSEVRELIQWNGGVVARGTFTQVNGSSTRGLAFWNGASWSPLPAMPAPPNKVVSFNGQLIADASVLQGPGWATLGQGLNDPPWTLTTFQGQLVAGGNFTASGSTAIAHVAQWNGSAWTQIGAGLDNAVNDLIEYRGQLYACGWFHSPTSGGTDYIARWNGTSWSGIPGVPIAAMPWRMAVINDELFLAGYGGLQGFVSSYDGAAWKLEFTTVNYEPTGIVSYGDAIVVGAANTLITRRDGVWTQSPPLVTSSGFPKVIDLVVHSGQLFIGGSFSGAGGNPAANIVRYSETSSDFNGDGDYGTDQDVEAFFRCLSGDCCARCRSADFNADGDMGTEQDIEAFFRVLAGGC